MLLRGICSRLLCCHTDQRDREVDRWPVCLKCRTGLSECGHLTGKPLASSSSQVDNPATSPSPFPIHCDLPTEENKYSGSERSGFAEPAHIAAETLLATHRRTRCALKRFADRSQPTLLGVLSGVPTGSSGTRAGCVITGAGTGTRRVPPKNLASAPTAALGPGGCCKFPPTTSESCLWPTRLTFAVGAAMATPSSHNGYPPASTLFCHLGT